MDNKFNKRRKARHGTLAERRTAKRLGARLTPGSGSLDGAKADFFIDKFLIENKSTINNSLSLKLGWLLKIQKEALEKNLQPALSLQFVNGNGQHKKNGNWVVIPEEIFAQILNYKEESDDWE